LALVKYGECNINLQVFTPLYRGVKDTLMIANTSKESWRSL